MKTISGATAISLLVACFGGNADAGGSDIVRIVPSSLSQPPGNAPLNPAVEQPPVLPPARPPAAPERPPPSTSPGLVNGRILRLPVRFGSLAADPRRAWLGVNMETLERTLATAFGLHEPRGALLIEATPGSPASTSGLRAGDIVLSVNGVGIADAEALRQRITHEQPNSQSTFEIWRFVPDGKGFLETLRGMADSGSAPIMAMLGTMHANGRGVARDDAIAAGWFRRGANAGDAICMVEIGQFFIAGRGVEKDPQEGLSWLRKAAETGHAYGMWRYGLELREGKLVTKDLNAAVQLIRRSAEAGYSLAMYDIALMNADGTGMPRNYGEAVRWYQKAVDLNNSAAMVNLGILYNEGRGVDRDDFKATELYRRAGQLGHVNGLHNWAVMLDSGRGVSAKDPVQAAELVYKALERGGEFSYRQMLQNQNGYSPQFRMALQTRLRDEGYYNGPIDGSFGPTTQASITAFFNRNKN